MKVKELNEILKGQDYDLYKNLTDTAHDTVDAIMDNYINDDKDPESEVDFDIISDMVYEECDSQLLYYVEAWEYIQSYDNTGDFEEPISYGYKTLTEFAHFYLSEECFNFFGKLQEVKNDSNN